MAAVERDTRGWIVLTRELASDLLELADAELEATRQELSRVWRGAWVIALLAGLAACLLFWLVALLAFTLVALLDRWLEPWAAGLAVGGAFLILALGLAAWAWARARRLESPLTIVARRLSEHLEWWRREVSLEEQEVGRRPRPGAPPAGRPG